AAGTLVKRVDFTVGQQASLAGTLPGRATPGNVASCRRASYFLVPAHHRNAIHAARAAVFSSARQGPAIARPSSVTARFTSFSGRLKRSAAVAYAPRSTIT